MQAVDTVITARWVLPIEPHDTVLEWHSVIVHQGRIVALLPASEVANHFEPANHLLRKEHLLLPGFVNAHVDLAQVLLRDMQPLPLVQLLHISADPEFVRAATELAIADALLAGFTCFAGSCFAPDIMAATVSEAHMRGSVGLPVAARESLWAADSDGYLQRGLQLRDDYREDPWITTHFALTSECDLTPDILDRIRRNADEIELPISLSLDAEHCGLWQLLTHGLLSPLLLARSSSDLDKEALQLLASQQSSLLWSSQQSLNVFEECGLNVALGSHAAGQRGQLDALALLRARLVDRPYPALLHAVLRALTLGGAHALGMEEQAGSLSVGKAADLTCVDLARINTQPVINPIAQFVLHASRDAISDVWIAGRPLLENGELTRMDVQRVTENARAQYNLILRHH